MDVPPISEEELGHVYTWVDSVNLSRPKKNIARDFADGCMMAEIVSAALPRLVELHNYPQAHSVQQKQYNWSTLNFKVFKRIGFQLSKKDIDNIINCQHECIERVLKAVQIKIEKYIEGQKLAERLLIEKQQNQSLQQQAALQAQQQQPTYQDDPRMLLAEKDNQIQDLRETVEILELKIKKLEQLIQLKDGKISSLVNQLNIK